jgi:protein-disulfide isomerase
MKLIAAVLATILPCLAASPAADKGKLLGNPSAPVTIEIFSDFECPMCKTFHEGTVPLLMRDFVTSGKACIVSREFPLNIPAHKYSRQAANYATAAARIGKYDAVANVLFHTQESWGASGKVWETVASVLTPEQQKKVQALVSDPSVLAEVQDDVSYGVSSGINGTPTLFVSRGSKLYPATGGVLAYNLLKSMIDDLLK